MLNAVTMRGADLEADVLAMGRALAGARLDAPRLTAQDTATLLRRQARTAFAGAKPLDGNKRFADSIRVKRMGRGWYRVWSKATYTRGRSVKVDLLWVFDAGPMVTGRGGKGIAVPIGRVIGSSSKRLATPAEAEAMGWTLSFLPLKSGKGWLIMGKLAGGDFGKMYGGANQPSKPLFILLKGGVKMPKRFDLDGLMRQQSPKFEQFAVSAYDRRMARSTLKFI